MHQYLKRTASPIDKQPDILKFVTLLLSKDFVYYFRHSRFCLESHDLEDKVRYTVFHVRSAETNLTLILSSPKSFVCNLPDSGRNVTRPNQGLSMGRRENLGMRLPCRQSVLEILLAG